MQLIEVPCPVCADSAYDVVFEDTLGARPPVFGYKWVPEIRDMYRAVRCRTCHHMYSSPRLENMYAYYADVSDDGYLDNSGLRRATANRVLGTMRRFVPSGRLLDVGCSTGDFLDVARQWYDVEGLELSVWGAAIARQHGLTVHPATLQEHARTGVRYDVVTMWGVIEHLEYPAAEVRHVNHLMNVGGIFCLWTGDSESFWARVMGRNWWYILGQHVQFFSWRSMDRLMADNGFERVHKGVYPYVISFKYLGISLSRYRGVGALARSLFRVLGLDRRQFVLRKSDEMFAIYRKVRET